MAVDDDAGELSRPSVPLAGRDPDATESWPDGHAPGDVEEPRTRGSASQDVREADGRSFDEDMADAEDRPDASSVGAEHQSRIIESASPVRLAAIAGIVIILTLTGIGSFLAVNTYHARQHERQKNLFLQAGRQGALNLTTIDYEHVDGDVQRILDSATGDFRNEFSSRAKPFVEVVKQSKSKSVGTVTEAGVESETTDSAQILVAVAVKTTNAGSSDERPRAWRMRLAVTKVGAEAKVSNVEFVP